MADSGIVAIFDLTESIPALNQESPVRETSPLIRQSDEQPQVSISHNSPLIFEILHSPYSLRVYH